MTKEDLILTIAEEEFLDKGYDSTSTAVIAHRAGVTHAMVNYYFRSKEKLFITVMGKRMHELLERVRSFMKADGRMTDVIEDAALTIFDSFNSCRKLPFLILDIARTHPEFLLEHRAAASVVFSENFRDHTLRLSSQIEAGTVSECSMGDIYDTVLSLASAPFMMIPILQNVMAMSTEQIEAYLTEHRAEMIRVLHARYGISRPETLIR